MELDLRIILDKPVSSVDHGLQKGAGNSYEVVQKQNSSGGNLIFTFPVTVKDGKEKHPGPVLGGPFVQGPSGGKFVYIDIGTYAGQADSAWSRRLKVPLAGIDWNLINNMKPKQVLQTTVPGTGKDGGPNCATVKPFAGWTIA